MNPTAFVFVVALSLAAANPVWKEVCFNHCHMDGAPEFHNGLDEACSAYRHVLPKPKVYGYCRKGFEHHFEMVCRNMCGNQKHHMSMGEAAGGQFCKQYKRQMPKPGAHEACKHGHARGGAVAHTWALAKLKEYNALKAATHASDQVIEAVMEKEAEIEEEIAQNHKNADGPITSEEIKSEFAEIEKEEGLAGKQAEELELAREAARAAYDSTDETENPADLEEGDGENATEIDL
jgi:hypothetical protein